MANKERYKEVLVRILNDHYNDIKLKNSGTKDRQQYIDGYLIAARALDVFSYDELKEIIDDTHFKIFGKTIPERKQSEIKKSFQDNHSLSIPTHIRWGISLDDK
jgi:hypothetical protein